jgi:hypothetical protein
MLATYTAEWEEKTRTEKEREVELEHLRHAVSTHIEVAQLLILDLNVHQLRGQLHMLLVRCFSTFLEKPAEVEEKLRLEMERIMKRNIEVQNENRAMEESMSEIR